MSILLTLLFIVEPSFMTTTNYYDMKDSNCERSKPIMIYQIQKWLGKNNHYSSYLSKYFKDTYVEEAISHIL